jgi:hypothetical protein
MALDSIVCGEADMMLCGVCNLEYPYPFNEISKVPPGALFFMIEKTPAEGRSYGKLRLDSEGHIEFMGSEITDLNIFVRRCLAGCAD